MPPTTAIFLNWSPEQAAAPARTFVVLGAPRGGTSMIAGVLALLGIDMGERTSLTHEDPDLLPGLSFRNPLRWPEAAARVRSHRRTVSARNAAHPGGVWGWKSPNVDTYLPFVRGLLVNPFYILVVRNPMAVAESTAGRTDRAWDRGFFRSLGAYRTHMGRVLREERPALVVSFEAACARRKIFAQEIARFCGIEMTPRQRSAILKFIDPNRGYVKIDDEEAAP